MRLSKDKFTLITLVHLLILIALALMGARLIYLFSDLMTLENWKLTEEHLKTRVVIPTTTGWLTYESKDSGYKIKYPQDWTFTKKDLIPGDLKSVGDERVSFTNTLTNKLIHFESFPRPEAMGLDDFVEAYFEALEKETDFSRDDSLEFHKMQVRGIVSQKVSWVKSDGTQEFNIIQIFIPLENKVISLSISYQDENDLKIFNLMISTLSFWL